MKTITVIGATKVISTDTLHRVGHDFTIEGDDEMSVFDGYHTFEELYDHRIALFITMCRLLGDARMENEIWRSKQHHVGGSPMYEGWFILGITMGNGEQISYHLPIDRWDETHFAKTLDNAPAWDGHTPAEVLERLKSL